MLKEFRASLLYQLFCSVTALNVEFSICVVAAHSCLEGIQDPVQHNGVKPHRSPSAHRRPIGSRSMRNDAVPYQIGWDVRSHFCTPLLYSLGLSQIRVFFCTPLLQVCELETLWPALGLLIDSISPSVDDAPPQRMGRLKC